MVIYYLQNIPSPWRTQELLLECLYSGVTSYWAR